MRAAAKRRDDLKVRAKTLQRDLAARERRRLTERVRLVRVARRRARAKIRAWARAKRAEIREAYRAASRESLERLREARGRRLVLVRERAELLRDRARRRFDAVRAGRLRELQQEIADQRLVLERERERVRAKQRTTRRERRAESDDEVRRNLSPDYRPIFDRVRGGIRGSARRTRTEAFLEWLEEHPDEVLALQAAAAERAVDEMVRARLSEERSQARGTESAVVAAWRGRRWRLERRGDSAWLEMRDGRRRVRWQVLERDSDWSLGTPLRGRPTKTDGRIARAWVDSLDGWQPLDDLSDVPF